MEASKKSPPEEISEARPTQRLSQSILWELQRHFFDRQGVTAWARGTVPHYITSNPFIAEAYAKVVLGFLRDSQASAGHPGQHLYAVELGAGPGRFAYHFLKKFLPLYRCSAWRDVPFTYVLTDFTDRNFEFWRTHPSFQPFIEAGQLDFARFDAEHDDEMKTEMAGDLLTAGSIDGPLVVFANYVFDSIRQDAFIIQDGQLYESLMTTVPSVTEADLEKPETLPPLEISFTRSPAPASCYENPAWDRILREYEHRLGDTAVLFPCAALLCIQALQKLSRGPLLLLSSDHGEHQEARLLGRKELQMSFHGSFSLPVNYHAIGRYFLHQGGQAFHTSRNPVHLNVSAFLSAGGLEDCSETRQAYEDAVERFGPDDFFILKRGLENVCASLSLEQILAHLKLSGWDARTLLDCSQVLLERLDSSSDAAREDIHHAVQRVWDLYFPIGEEEDLPFVLGMLLYQISYYPEALTYFEHSLRLHGTTAATSYNLGMCYYGLRQIGAALRYVEEALALDPGFEPARAMRIVLESESASRRP